MVQKVSLLIISLFVLFITGFSNEHKLEPTQHLSIADGLAHNGVTSILQDSKGYIWIGTYDGLNRYDGYEFTIFKNTPARKLFVSNRIRTLAEDSKQNLWLGTDEGISIYNSTLQQFSNVYSNAENDGATGPIVREILINDEKGIIICATENEGLIELSEDHSFVNRYIPSVDLGRNILFLDGLEIGKGQYIFTTSIGVLHFNLINGKFELIVRGEIGQHNSILKVDEKTLLITKTRGFVTVTINERNDSLELVVSDSKMNNYQFRKIAGDNLGNLWLSTLNEGVVQFNKESILNNTPELVGVFEAEGGIFRASCILTDKNSGCWVGTFDKGVYRFRLGQNPFYSNAKTKFDFSVNANRVTHITAYDKNRILLTSQFDGLTIYNTANNSFETLPAHIKSKNSPSLSAVFVDSRGDIWITYNNQNGFCRIKANSGELECIESSFDFSENLSALRSISEDRQGNIWAVDFDDVFKINVSKDSRITRIESLEENPYFDNKPLSLVRCVYKDPQYDILWVGTSADGLFRITMNETNSLKTADVEQYIHEDNNHLSVSSNFISCLVRLPNGELWLGTERGGICKIINSESNPEFVNYSEDQGLSNNVVKSIVFDNNNNLWVATNNGLNKFDTKILQFRIFKKDNGLPFEDFYYSSSKLQNGKIVMAGLNGFCYFNPKDVPQIEELPKLEFNNFKIFNQIIEPGDSINKRTILEKSLTETDGITLKYNENVFSLELTSLHFSTPENHYLRYQLFPINEQWVEVPSSQRVINYNGLPPGEYELKVMASNAINEWTSPKTLNVIIEPPFWLTFPAFVIYFLFVGLMVYSVMFYILRMNKLQHSYEIEHLEKENVKEVNAAKLRFFSNISHEIKTPLTLISGPINLLLERYRGNIELSDKLQIVQRQSKKISQLIDQVHNFQRADANKLKMNYTQFCFNDFISEMVTDFLFLARTDNKKLEIAPYYEKIYVSADKDKLEKILNNILNNAFKYTKEGHTISVNYKIEKNDLHISISDTGKGIANDDLPHIFERFYQSKHKHSEYTGGSGIGLAFTKRLVEMHYGYIRAESLLQKGTTLYIKLPIVIAKPSPEVLKAEEIILKEELSYYDEAQVKENLDYSKIQVEGGFSDASIFYAEDNVDMKRFVTSVLSRFFNVKSFSNGQELWDELKEEWPDIIVSDVLMPEMNGFDLCKNIKSDIKTSHIPVVLLTACITVDEQLKGLKVGADSYITKPFDVQHLVTRVETLLQNRKKLRERYQIDLPYKIEKKQGGKNDIAFLEKLYTLIEENLDNSDLDMDKLSKKLYLNRTHFFQKVKALTNQTPYELLKMYRLKRAAELIVQKHLSVNEVYVMTGFKSRSNFSKLFKEKYKTSPGKYAAQAIEKIS